MSKFFDRVPTWIYCAFIFGVTVWFWCGFLDSLPPAP